MTTILDIVNKLFEAKENEGRFFTFDEIFKQVESSLNETWLQENNNVISKSNLLENKMGIVYKLLTLDGGFIRHEDGTWSKRKMNESL